jgi:ABC-type transporter Mla subunit MlaD
MSTSNKPQVTVPAEMPREAAPEILAKRDQLIADLETAAKASTGTLQQVLRKMSALISNTKPGAALDNRLFQDVKDAFQRFSQDTEAAAKRPPVLMQSVEWMQAYLSSRGFAVEGAAATASAPAAAANPAAPRAAGGKDGFESGGSQRARVLGDVPPPPGAQPEGAKDQQQQLESFKTWMKNPGVGNVKG